MGFDVIPDRVSAGNVLDVAVNVGEEDELVLDVQKAAVHHLNNMFNDHGRKKTQMDQKLPPVQEFGCTLL
jgi:hypothetical protein